MAGALHEEMSSDLPGIPPEVISYNAGPAIISSLTAACVVALLVVGLRLWARRIKGLVLGLDDWLIIACTVRLFFPESRHHVFR